MSLRKLILPLIAAMGFLAPALQADEHDGENRFDQEIDKADFKAVRDFVASKAANNVQEKMSNLNIEGEVHVEWCHMNEKIRGRNIRGGNGVYIFREDEDMNDEIYLTGERLPLSRNDFDVQFDLKLKYKNESGGWAVAHVRYDESMGVDDNGLDCSIDPQGYHGSGSCDNICLKQAYMGYNLYQCGDSRLFIELGRRGNLYKVFDSEIQFQSRLDGAFVRYESKWECVADWYVQAAGFVVDERVNQFAWVAEVGFVNICDTGIEFKYSFIDWVKQGKNRCFARNPIGFKFRNSQFTTAYNFEVPCLTNQPLRLVGAFLWNHTPARYTFLREGTRKKNIGTKNLGWYVGLNIGDLDDGAIGRKGDWSVNVIYAVVQAQCMPDNDVHIIGTGNAEHFSFSADGIGNTNWRGWQLNGVYGLTNNITMLAEYEASTADDKHIAGNHTFNKFKVEAVYAF